MRGWLLPVLPMSGHTGVASGFLRMSILVSVWDSRITCKFAPGTTTLASYILHLIDCASLKAIENTNGLQFLRDQDRCGFITTSPRHAGSGFQATARLILLNLTVDGSANRVRHIIVDQGLDVQVQQHQ